MAISDELSAFVKESLAKGLPPAQIEDALRRAGWPDEQIRGGLAGFASVDFPVPVPRPRPNLSARDAFLYLVLFATLYPMGGFSSTPNWTAPTRRSRCCRTGIPRRRSDLRADATFSPSTESIEA